MGTNSKGETERELFRDLFGDSDVETAETQEHCKQVTLPNTFDNSYSHLMGCIKNVDIRTLFNNDATEEAREIPGLVFQKRILPPELSTAFFKYLEHVYFSETPKSGDTCDIQPRTNQGMYFGEFPQFHPFSFLEQICRLHPSLLPASIRNRTPSLFNQAIINLYDDEEGIGDHVDLFRFEDGVVGFSFGGPCVMQFRKATQADKLKAAAQDPKGPYGVSKKALCYENYHKILLESGDVYAMSGEARYEWTHGIKETSREHLQGFDIARARRISVTLRKLVDSNNGCN
ncbi:hypothetical protein H4219_003790 [Mycoemilia scoparia]|uniref:Fe2OG dioxygenase domain-containing protein n=1 Tax=Mycoemilia scoparia TaxID=417184 RepID=A0A9W8A1R7_9FUNG|nr:hypothetical protein H4219_003790 [Mycoemilia scoparia]